MLQDATLSTLQATTSAPPTQKPKQGNNSGYVSLGSTENQVIEIIGTPNKIEAARWYYGDDWVSFDIINKTVRGWNKSQVN